MDHLARQVFGPRRRRQKVHEVVDVVVDEGLDDKEEDEHIVEICFDEPQLVELSVMDRESEVMEVIVVDDGPVRPISYVDGLQKKDSKRRLFGSPRTAVGVQERMIRMMRRHAQSEDARLAALRQVQHDDCLSATNEGFKTLVNEPEEETPTRTSSSSPRESRTKRPSFFRGRTKHMSLPNPVRSKSKTSLTSSSSSTRPRSVNSSSSSLNDERSSTKMQQVIFLSEYNREEESLRTEIVLDRDQPGDEPSTRPLPARTKVKSMVHKYEELQARALRDAEQKEENFIGFDEDDARRERRRRKADELRARQAAKARNAVAKPSFTNVSPSPLELRVRVDCETPEAAIHVSLDGGATWMPYADDIIIHRHHPQEKNAKKKKVVVLASAQKSGMVNSDVATAVFSVEPPRFVRHSAFPQRQLEYSDGYGRHCSLCAAPCGPAYVARDNNGVVFTLCPECALAPLSALAGGPERRAQGDSTKKDDHQVAVAVDAGAHRLWLSENVLFRGNTADVLPQSQHLLDALAAILTQHPAICVRLEGHTNSTCNLTCDGTSPCPYNRCFVTFGKSGGALAFSKARADAVKACLVKSGVEPDRIDTQGLAGSRRVVDDCEAHNNFLNRRVEIHTLNFLS